MSTWDSGQNTDSAGTTTTTKNHSSEKYIFRPLVSPHLVALCVTPAADLLHLLITKREKKRRKFFFFFFYYLPAERRGANTAVGGRARQRRAPSLMHHQPNGQLRADFIVPCSPWDEDQGEAEKSLPVWGENGGLP